MKTMKVAQHADASKTVAGGCRSSAKRTTDQSFSKLRYDVAGGCHSSANTGAMQQKRRSFSKLRLQGLLPLIMILCFAFPLFAETFAVQSFENSPADTWNYSPNTLSSGYWGLMDDVFGVSAAHSGAQYWASWNLGSNEGTLSFDNVTLPAGYIYTFSFYYYTRLLSAPSEYSSYSISYDNGNSWGDWIILSPNTQAWTLVSVEIPAYQNQIKLKVATKHSGTGKYAHWDSFLLSRTAAPPQAPTVYNLQFTQRTDGSRLVDIFYDIFDANNDLSTVALTVSNNAGASYEISPSPANLSGDVGANIASGTVKHIIWNAGAENLSYEGDQYKLRLLAEDNSYPPVAIPVFTPEGGTFTTTQTVSITCATTGATIRYTINGTEPTESSANYSIPITVSTTTTLKAKAFKVLWTTSETATAVYTINIPMPANFVLVAGGTFSNGTSNVTVSSFYMDKYELTQAGYQAVMGVNPSYYNGVSNGPVEQVSWFNAIEYCNKRSISEGLTPCYSYSTYGTNPANWPAGWNTSSTNHTNVSCNWTANGYRLPTEMEWQYAARGGNQTHNYTYSGSNDVNAVAWYSSNSGSTTHTVGTKIANELGIFDLSGNVWEWNWDIYGSYPSGSQTNPTGAASGSARVLRGGSWDFNANYCTVSYRGGDDAPNSNGSVGFRICRVSP